MIDTYFPCRVKETRINVKFLLKMAAEIEKNILCYLLYLHKDNLIV